MKILIILRGVSGSGKSDFAHFLSTIYKQSNPPKHYRFFNVDFESKAKVERCVVCCADDYHMQDGMYQFKAENLGEAHLQCRIKASEAMGRGTELVIIANTNTKEGDFNYYEESARLFNYKVVSLVVENRHGNTDVHDVPENVLEIQEDNLRKSLKLR